MIGLSDDKDHEKWFHTKLIEDKPFWEVSKECQIIVDGIELTENTKNIEQMASSKFILGAAQFGLDYGISNIHGKTSIKEVKVKSTVHG